MLKFTKLVPVGKFIRNYTSRYTNLTDLSKMYTSQKEEIFKSSYERLTQIPKLLPSLTYEPILSSSQVFTHNEVNLDYVTSYGFDYDYTLANYTSELPKLIYTMLKDSLILKMGYSKSLESLQYDEKFAIRGLHYDVKLGYLMKVDAYHNIQLNTVYYGKEPLTNKEKDLLLSIHNGNHLSPSYMKENMIQLNDMFSLPEVCLISDVVQHFKDHKINFNPRHLYDDVRSMGESIHSSSRHHPLGVGPLHLKVLEDVEKYLDKSTSLVNYLERLKKGNKQLFLLTNSGYPFVNKGLSHVTGLSDWKELFDVVVVSAGKPNFYKGSKPFRRVKIDTELPSFRNRAGKVLEGGVELDMDTVGQFKRNEVYMGGNLTDFSRLTGWYGQKVLYIGDHIYSDLIDPTLQQGWRTGAIVDELDFEIESAHLPQCKQHLLWLQLIESLIKLATVKNLDTNLQLDGNTELEAKLKFVQMLRDERRSCRLQLKRMYNHQFGSVFRTDHNPTYFANKVRTFADLYTSKLENFNNYNLDYTFYPDRIHLPHELPTF